MARETHKTSIIPISKPHCDQSLMKDFFPFYVKGKWGNGEKTKEFEEKFSEYLDPNKTLMTLAVNTGTAAYHLAFKVAGINKDAEVITTPLNNTSVIEAIRYNGAIPVFADVLYDTLNLDPKDIVKKITPKTKAIIVTHFSGSPCDMDTIMLLAKQHNLIIVEDCSNSIGGEYNGSFYGKKIGSIGNISCFPLNTTQPLCSGDGGMIVFQSNEEIANRLKQLRKITTDDFNYVERNNDYLMSDIHATIGLAQLSIIDKLNEYRRIGVENYIKSFKKIKQIEILKLNSDKLCIGNFIVKLHGLNRSDLMEYLLANNISSDINYKPLYLYPKYKQYDKNNTPIANTVWKTLLTLPLSPTIRKEIPYITTTLKNYIKQLLIALRLREKKESNEPAK